MQLLVIGGTRFLGRAIVDAALVHGHEVTLFNRGQSNPDLYPKLDHIVGDRDGGLAALNGRSWDAVIDTCGYVPRLVEASARYLADAVDHYTFISTLSVYADSATVGIDEDGRAGSIGRCYHRKRLPARLMARSKCCASKPRQWTPWSGRALLVRSGLIVGPHDPTDRFSYWPDRIVRGGEVLAPGEPTSAVQFIDVRDIADWVVRATEQRLVGPYNVTGPAERLSMGELLAACHRAAGGEASLTWVDEAFLLNHEVQPFTDLPLWVSAEDVGFTAFSIDKALAASLTIRPLADTIGATLDWLATRPDDHTWRAGLAPEREAALLAEWHATQRG